MKGLLDLRAKHATLSLGDSKALAKAGSFHTTLTYNPWYSDCDRVMSPILLTRLSMSSLSSLFFFFFLISVGLDGDALLVTGDGGLAALHQMSGLRSNSDSLDELSLSTGLCFLGGRIGSGSESEAE